MSISDTLAAQRYASRAEVAAAETKALLGEATKAPEYADEARIYAEQAAASSTSAQEQSSIASSAATEAVSAAQSAADNATTIIESQLTEQQEQFQNFLLSYGLQFIGDYEDGPLTFTARNQYIRYDETYWQVSSSTNLPFTTTGTNSSSWSNDLPSLTPISDDDALRSSLSSDSGSSLVGFVGGGTVQQQIISIKGDIGNIEYFNDQLRSPYWISSLGKISSFEALRELPPSFEGQFIILSSYNEGSGLGGGVFQSVSSDGDDDGGYICKGSSFNDLMWKRVITGSELNAEFYGIYPDSTRASPGSDNTIPINSMLSTAIKNNFSVRFSSTVLGSSISERGYYITSNILATGIHIIKGQLLIHFKSNSFDSSFDSHQVLLGDPKTSASTIQDGLLVDYLAVRDLDKRGLNANGSTVNSAANGIYIKYTHVIGIFKAVDLNGSGVEMAPVYDSSLDVTTERCGNVSTPAIYCNGNGDECNAIDFTILCHDSYHKGIYIAGSKINIVRGHVESTAVLTTDDGYTGLTGAATNTDLRYSNHTVYITDGTIGNLSINDYSYTDGKTYHDDQNSLSGSAGSHLAMALINSKTSGTISNPISTAQGGAKGRVSVFTGNTYSAIGYIRSGYLYLESTSRVSIDQVNTSFFSSWSILNSVSGGYIDQLSARVICRFNGVRFNSALSLPDASSYVQCSSCTLVNGISNLSGNTNNSFANMVIPSITLTSSSMPEVCRFNNCDITSVRISGGLSSFLYKDVEFTSCKLRGSWSLSSDSWNRVLFKGSENTPVNSSFNISGFSMPRHANVGTICANPKNSYTTGDVVLALRTLNNSDGSGTWTPIFTMS